MSKLKIFDTWELYTSKESLEHVQYKFKEKKYDFFQKKKFFNIFNFFSKGGTLWCRNRQKKFFPFFKNFKNKTQKWLSWDHSNINRNKVMNFGGRSSYPAETARPFMVVRAIMAPPVQNRVKFINLKHPRQNWKITFTGPFKHEQKQSHEFWWS